MIYRTRTYIAADWTGDKDAVNQLTMWNEERTSNRNSWFGKI